MNTLLDNVSFDYYLLFIETLEPEYLDKSNALALESLFCERTDSDMGVLTYT